MAKKEQIEVISDTEDDDYDSESDVTEDEDGLDLTPALDAAILRTLGKIRRGEGVYNAEKVLEEELAQAEAEALKRGVKVKQAKKDVTKPYLLADHHRAALLSGQVNDVEDEETYEQRDDRAPPMTYVQEERKMRKDAIDAFKSFGGDDADDGEDDFAPVKREKDEKEEDEADEGYRQFLLEMGGGEDEVRRLLGMGDQPVSHVRDVAEELEGQTQGEEKKKESSKKREKRLARKKQDDDSFLMDYILNRGWVDKEDDTVPTYDEITAPKPRAKAESDDEDESNPAGPSHPWGVLDEDEFDEKADEFETKYNFRYEEPGAEEIASHPRSIPSLVRRPDDARKLKREARAERKAAAAAAREEEMRKQKGSKRREMESQLSALRKEIGEKQWAKIEQVLEGDYDEDEWERVVGEALAGVEDGDGGEEGDEGEEEGDEKPSWDDDDEAYGDYEEYEDGAAEGQDGEMEFDDGPVNMDADFIGFDEEPSKKKRKKDKKNKKKGGQAEDEEEAAIDENLTVAERAAKVKEAMTEYKALDHEDMIGDLPTRFHYTQTAPTAFGLSAAEILMATDEELNALMSVKHIAPYRKGGLGAQGKGLGKRVKDLKNSLAGRKWGEEDWAPKGKEGAGARQQDGGYAQRNGAAGEGKKKRMGRNERKRKAAAAGLDQDQDASADHETAAGANGHNQDKPMSIEEQRRALEREAAAQTVQGSAFRGGVHPSRLAQVDSTSHTRPQVLASGVADGGEEGEGEGEGKKRRKKKKKSAVA